MGESRRVLRNLAEPQAVLILSLGVIGLGNIWRFPSLVLQHGGSAFLLVYVLALLLLACPLLMAELSFGKIGERRFSLAVADSVTDLRLPRAWLLMRYTLPWAGIFLIALYGAIAGWGLGFLYRAAAGVSLHVEDAQSAANLFLALASDPERSMLWHTLFWIMVTLISAQGWQRGLLRAAYWFAALMVICALSLADMFNRIGAPEGATLFFHWRPEALSWRGVLDAMAQACFTLSLGLGMAYTVGRRLPDKANVFQVGVQVGFIDLMVSLFLGVALFSLLSPQDSISAGVRLVFVDVLLALAGEKPAQITFFALLVLVATTTAVLLIEPFVTSVQERFETGRIAASSAVCILAWTVGLLAVFSFGPWREWEGLGRGIIEWLVYLPSNLLIPLNCLLLAGYVGRALPPYSVATAAHGPIALTALWYGLLRYPVRLVLVVVLLYSTGLLQLALDFFGGVDAT